MRLTFIALCLISLVAAAPAFAQQQQQQPIDPAVLQRAFAAVRVQREEAADKAAWWEARANGIAEELAKAHARIKELEPKPDAAPPK